MPVVGLDCQEAAPRCGMASRKGPLHYRKHSLVTEARQRFGGKQFVEAGERFVMHRALLTDTVPQQEPVRSTKPVPHGPKRGPRQTHAGPRPTPYPGHSEASGRAGSAPAGTAT